MVVKPNKFCSKILSRNWIVAREWVPEWDERTIEGRIRFASKSEAASGWSPGPFPAHVEERGWEDGVNGRTDTMSGTLSVIMKDEISLLYSSGIMRGRAASGWSPGPFPAHVEERGWEDGVNGRTGTMTGTMSVIMKDEISLLYSSDMMRGRRKCRKGEPSKNQMNLGGELPLPSST
jgi:hypothetical protein